MRFPEPASKLFHDSKGFLNLLVKQPDVLYISFILKVRVLWGIVLIVKICTMQNSIICMQVQRKKHILYLNIYSEIFMKQVVSKAAIIVLSYIRDFYKPIVSNRPTEWSISMFQIIVSLIWSVNISALIKVWLLLTSCTGCSLLFCRGIDADPPLFFARVLLEITEKHIIFEKRRHCHQSLPYEYP